MASSSVIPTFTKRVCPTYPRIAQLSRLEGSVSLQVIFEIAVCGESFAICAKPERAQSLVLLSRILLSQPDSVFGYYVCKVVSIWIVGARKQEM